MTAITYGGTAPRAGTAATKAEIEKRGFLKRVVLRLMEARMHEAEQEIARYYHLVPSELESFGHRLTAKNESALPFGK
ncbi:MAG TPA: hypothetical protein VHN11_12270 [Xanthobacteraceae bacterium]|jgi:hypothetical protein|nr:hypothetical protein [Xanthobacteraceae bacterium]